MPDFSFIIRDKTHAVFASSIGQKALAALFMPQKRAELVPINVGFTSTLPPLPDLCELDEQADGIKPWEFMFNPGAPAGSAKPRNLSADYRDSAGCLSLADDHSLIHPGWSGVALTEFIYPVTCASQHSWTIFIVL